MWLVRDIAQTPINGGDRVRVPFISLFEFEYMLHLVCVKLKNSETGEIVTIETDLHGTLVRELRKYKPYGFIDGETMESELCFLIVIDDLSWRFLDYVASVDSIVVDHSQEDGYDRYIDDGCIFDPLDEYKTLFSATIECEECLCTLFQALHYFTVGHRMYLYAGREYSEDNDDLWEEGYDIVLLVRYSDKANAKALMTKADLAWANPLRNIGTEG